MDRRRFLQRAGLAAGAAAFPTFIPRSAWGANDRIRLGFIGVRNRGMQNLAPMIKHAVAVCDVDRNNAAEAKYKIEKTNGGQCLAYLEYREMLENPDIDAVVVSTPDHWHALCTVDACAAGKDVYCEKPLTLTIEEGKRMIRAARRYNRVVQTGSQQRSDAKFRLACELVRNGKLGKIQSIEVGLPGPNWTPPPMADERPPAELDYDFWLGPAPYRPYNVKRVHYLFRFFWNYSGGQMTNFGAHHLDIVQWALGMDGSGPVSAEATAHFQKDGWYETPETFEITYRYADGTPVKCGTGQRGGITFVGEKGKLFVDRGKLEATPKELLSTQFSGSDTRLYVSDDHYANWLECLRTRKTPICDVEIGHRSATLCHLGNIAVRTGRKVRWDPKAERVVGDYEQSRMLFYDYRGDWRLSS